MHTMMDYPLTLTAILERAGKYFGDREIISRMPDRSIDRSNYAALHRRSRQLAEGLLAAGLKRGDRVATLMWNHYVHMEAYFGVPAAGCILHPLNVRLHPDELAYIATHAEDRVLIVDDVLVPLLEKFKSRVKFERIFVVRHSADSTVGPYEDYHQWLRQASGQAPLPQISEQDGASMCFTSGTTGNPKGVIYSHRSQVLHSFAMAMADGCAVSEHDVVLPGSSMFHANAWGLPYTSVMAGAKVVLPGPHMDPESLLSLIEQEKVTLTSAVPTVWLTVLAALEQRGPNWRFPQDIRIVCGGTAPPEALIRGLDRHGFHLMHLWGMTETSPMATLSPIRPSMHDWSEDEKYQSRSKQGWPMPFVDTRVMTPDGEAPQDGKTAGELEVRGCWVAGSYYRSPQSSDRWTADGWFRTGDVATADPDGCIRLVDRSKDLIKSGGEWISSVDLENTLMSHPAVREAGVVAAPHAKWEERPLAVVAFKPGASATPEELRAFLGARFAKWQLPDDFVFVDELPHTSTGKLLKTELRKRYAAWSWSQAANSSQ
jgi:fatty-acyl-CoA synthase